MAPFLGTTTRPKVRVRLKDNYQAGQVKSGKRNQKARGGTQKAQEPVERETLAYQRGKVARLVYEARERLGVSQEEMAARIGHGVKLSTIRDLELGRLLGDRGPAKRARLWLKARLAELKAPDSIAAQARAKRADLQISQAKLAKAAGVPVKVVVHVERGEATGARPGSHARRLLEFLGIAPPSWAAHGLANLTTPCHLMGAALKAARLSQGLTCKDVQRLCGVHFSSVSKVEAYGHHATPTAEQVAAVLGVDLAPFAKQPSNSPPEKK